MPMVPNQTIICITVSDSAAGTKNKPYQHDQLDKMNILKGVWQLMVELVGTNGMHAHQ